MRIPMAPHPGVPCVCLFPVSVEVAQMALNHLGVGQYHDGEPLVNVGRSFIFRSVVQQKNAGLISRMSGVRIPPERPVLERWMA